MHVSVLPYSRAWRSPMPAVARRTPCRLMGCAGAASRACMLVCVLVCVRPPRPGSDGIPQEFALQDAFAAATKKTFPRAKVLEYRITDAVPYDPLVHDLIVNKPEYFVRWTHAPNNNGSVCQMPYEENKTKGFNCSWPIIASAYDWSQPVVQQWFLENIVKPTLVVGDGVWLDGDGPDNGAYMCRWAMHVCVYVCMCANVCV